MRHVHSAVAETDLEIGIPLVVTDKGQLDSVNFQLICLAPGRNPVYHRDVMSVMPIG